ncbi:MAG: restriction endonuclease [bacterium]
MQTHYTDYNGADTVFAETYADQWTELRTVIEALPLHLKSSDQAGIQGSLIFDPVGTNEYVKAALTGQGWSAGIPIPQRYSFLGKDVDFGKSGLIAEVQFSNYPFLLNNALRSELFFKARLALAGQPTGALVIVTKAKMFPASNSTLYYEQAENQLTALIGHHVLDVPIRLVGLFEASDCTVDALFTEYDNARYSRTVAERTPVRCRIQPGRGSRSRSVLSLVG